MNADQEEWGWIKERTFSLGEVRDVFDGVATVSRGDDEFRISVSELLEQDYLDREKEKLVQSSGLSAYPVGLIARHVSRGDQSVAQPVTELPEDAQAWLSKQINPRPILVKPKAWALPQRHKVEVIDQLYRQYHDLMTVPEHHPWGRISFDDLATLIERNRNMWDFNHRYAVHLCRSLHQSLVKQVSEIPVLHQVKPNDHLYFWHHNDPKNRMEGCVQSVRKVIVPPAYEGEEEIETMHFSVLTTNTCNLWEREARIEVVDYAEKYMGIKRPVWDDDLDEVNGSLDEPEAAKEPQGHPKPK